MRGIVGSMDKFPMRSGLTIITITIEARPVMVEATATEKGNAAHPIATITNERISQFRDDSSFTSH
jgi:hypothetical protein